MDFKWTDEMAELRDTLRRFVAEEVIPRSEILEKEDRIPDELKKIVQARETDNTFSLKKYLTLYPYRTALMAFYAVGGTAALYWTGTAEFYTALVTGFAANSLSGAADK